MISQSISRDKSDKTESSSARHFHPGSHNRLQDQSKRLHLLCNMLPESMNHLVFCKIHNYIDKGTSDRDLFQNSMTHNGNRLNVAYLNFPCTLPSELKRKPASFQNHPEKFEIVALHHLMVWALEGSQALLSQGQRFKNDRYFEPTLN